MTDRVALSAIRTLTLYKDAYTTGRRSSPVPQLTCEGGPCSLYTPDVVRCVNAGGSGAEVDWTCEAELPSALRLGRVEVSCEGYSRPGDPTWDPAQIVFGFIFLAVLIFILLGFFKSYFGQGSSTSSGRGPQRPGPDHPRGGGRNMHGWPPYDDPPPYPGHSSPKPSAQQADNQWRPGFWTGTALGGLGAYLLHERNRSATAPNARSSAEYDWEREREYEARGTYTPPFSRRTDRWRNVDRGEGSSSSGLGEMRTSTGYGGSNVR